MSKPLTLSVEFVNGLCEYINSLGYATRVTHGDHQAFQVRCRQGWVIVPTDKEGKNMVIPEKFRQFALDYLESITPKKVPLSFSLVTKIHTYLGSSNHELAEELSRELSEIQS